LNLATVFIFVFGARHHLAEKRFPYPKLSANFALQIAPDFFSSVGDLGGYDRYAWDFYLVPVVIGMGLRFQEAELVLK